MNILLPCKLKQNAIAGVLILAAILLTSTAQSQTGSPEINFSTSQKDEFLIIDAHVDLPVSSVMAWAVITDYESYPKFISSMRESRIVTRNAEGVVVEQKGTFSFLFFSQEIDATLLVAEFPPNVIVSRSIKGNIQDMHSRYELRQVENGVRLTYSGRLVPSFSVPPIIGMSVVHFILKRNFREMVDEIVRRDSATRQPSRKGE